MASAEGGGVPALPLPGDRRPALPQYALDETVTSAGHVSHPSDDEGKETTRKKQRRGTTGRRRIPLEKIESLQARRVCFAKRRQGLFRKCTELCRLFPGYQIAAVAFSPDVGTPFDFISAPPSSSASPAELFNRFLSDRVPSPEVLCPTPATEVVSDDGPGTETPDAVSSMWEEEMTTEAALCWADSILQVGDEAAVDLLAAN